MFGNHPSCCAEDLGLWSKAWRQLRAPAMIPNAFKPFVASFSNYSVILIILWNQGSKQSVHFRLSQVELGLDSMSSMSLHSNLCQTAGVSLPFSIFYDEPTVLQAATLLHRLSGGSSSGEDLESMLQDADARRSYHLSQARDTLSRIPRTPGEVKRFENEESNSKIECLDSIKILKEALITCRKAAEGASGNALVSALALEAEVCQRLQAFLLSNEEVLKFVEREESEEFGEWNLETLSKHLLRTLRSLLSLCTEVYGADHPDTAVALGKLIKVSHENALEFHGRYQSYMRSITWVEAAGLSSQSQMEDQYFFGFGRNLMKLRSLNLDDQDLENFGPGVGRTSKWLSILGTLKELEVLKLRRNAISELPSSFGNLPLKELYLTGNSLCDLPKSFSNLSKLQVLCLERNRFVQLPSIIYTISRRLLQLGLDEQETFLEVDSEQSLLIPKLSILRARGCQASFPSLVLEKEQSRPNLNTIFWANNGLREFPRLDALSGFGSLRLLDLAHNQISSIGDALESTECLRNLRDLSLAGNRLHEVPSKISSCCPCLQQLWLHGNELKELPEELGDLQSLAILELHHNQLGSFPKSFQKLQKLNWLFAHCNKLSDSRIIKILNSLPRLKIVGLGCNELPLQHIDLHSLQASYGLGWNLGISKEDEVLTEALTTTDLHWDTLKPDEIQELLVVTFSAQGAPVAQGQAEVRALRDSLLPVDALYICDPANAWFLQDPSGQWKGLELLGLLGIESFWKTQMAKSIDGQAEDPHFSNMIKCCKCCSNSFAKIQVFR